MRGRIPPMDKCCDEVLSKHNPGNRIKDKIKNSDNSEECKKRTELQIFASLTASVQLPVITYSASVRTWSNHECLHCGRVLTTNEKDNGVQLKVLDQIAAILGINPSTFLKPFNLSQSNPSSAESRNPKPGALSPSRLLLTLNVVFS